MDVSNCRPRPCIEIPIYFDNFRVDKKKRGEKNEKEEMKQMMNTVRFLKIAHERDSEKIDKLSEMIEELLLFQRGKYSLTLVLIIGIYNFRYISCKMYVFIPQIFEFFRRCLFDVFESEEYQEETKYGPDGT